MSKQHEDPDIIRILKCFQEIRDAINRLFEMGIVRSRKFPEDFGEWLVAAIYDGRVAKRKTQEGWDVIVGTEKVQVKTHCKAPDNRNRWSSVKDPDKFDVLVILVLDETYSVQTLYRLPQEDVRQVAKPDRGGYRVNWADLEGWRIAKEAIPNAERFSVFFA